MISSVVVADSISPRGDRITTLENVFPRIILIEVNTYGMIAKSASSNRAIKTKDRIAEVRENPFVPKYWGENEPGMVAHKELPPEKQYECAQVWLESAAAAADYAEYLHNVGLHKQTVVRLIEPYLWQTNVMTATSFQNLFDQRIHIDAQPEFHELAIKMKEAVDNSTPKELDYGEWHLPFIDDDELDLELEQLKQISVARTARTSYGNQNQRNIPKDLELYTRLYEAEPRHEAPFEQIATPSELDYRDIPGRFKGWHSFRHLVT